MACLDTTLLLDYSGKGGKLLRERAREKIRSLVVAGENLTTTRLNVAEMWVGVERSQAPENELKAVEEVLSPLFILELDDASARLFGKITARLQLDGLPRGDMDVLIAAVALAHDQKVVTRNVRHFEGIAGLRVESY